MADVQSNANRAMIRIVIMDLLRFDFADELFLAFIRTGEGIRRKNE
jgi:hypothetical protein